MASRLSNPLARPLAARMFLGWVALAGLSPQAAVARGADGGGAAGATALGQDTESPPAPSAPETRAEQPPFDPIAARIKYLHDRLHITPEQEPLWDKVARVMQENAKAVAPLIRERIRSAQHGNAIDYLNSYEKLGETQLADLKKFVDAFQALYRSLSADQKKIADAIFRLGPLSMVGGIPELPEAFVAPAPHYYFPYYPTYPTLPPPYPIYPYYPAYPYYRPWLWSPPIGFGASSFLFFHGHRRFHGFHEQHRVHDLDRARHHR